MGWIKFKEKKPRSGVSVLVKGKSSDFGKVIVIGYYHKRENRFITNSKGWNVDFKLWQSLPK
jgi:hypothetical protein